MGRSIEGVPVPDGHEYVLQLAIGTQGVVDVIGDHGGQAGFVGQARQLRGKPVVIGQEVVLQLHVQPATGSDGLQLLERARRSLAVTRQQAPRQLAVAAAGEHDEALALLRQAFVTELRHGLAAGEVGSAGEPAEAGVAGLVLRQQRQVWSQLLWAHAAHILATRVTMAGRALPRHQRLRRLPCPGDGQRRLR